MGHMDFDMFKSIIDEISGKVPYITIASRGEPTMYKYFEDAMDYIRGKFLDIKINTNASLLTEKRASKILDTCHTVVFSIDTPDPDMYKNVRINGDLSKVLGNIKRFNELRFRHERRNEINTRASGVYFNTLQDFDNFTDFFSEFTDETSFVQYQPWEELYSRSLDDSGNGCCTQPFYSMYVWWDGTVNSCDMDYKSLLNKDKRVIGDGHLVRDAWNSEFLQSVRQHHIDGSRDTLYPCNICPMPC